MAGFEDILSVLCSQANKVSATDFQQIYLLGDLKEARLANDVLVTHGFEAKIYNEPDNQTARLYITLSGEPDATKLQSVLAYATALKNIKESMDVLRGQSETGINDYTLTLANTVSAGKQIAIYIGASSDTAQGAAPAAQQQRPTGAPGQQPRPGQQRPGQPAMKGPPRNGQPPKKRIMSATDPNRADEFMSGSSLSKKYPGQKNDGTDNQDGARNAVSRFFVKNIASNAVQIITTIITILVIFTVVVMLKGLLCVDLAHVSKNPPWYCFAEDNSVAKKALQQ